MKSFQEQFQVALSKSTLTEEEWGNLFLSSSRLFKQISYKSFQEILREEMVKNMLTTPSRSCIITSSNEQNLEDL